MAAATDKDADEADVLRSDAAPLPTAVVVDPQASDEPDDPLLWVRRGAYLAALVIGWLFIAWQYKFSLTAPAVFLCLGYLAIVSTIYALWRTGVVAVADEPEEADSTWGRPIGRRAELEREKKTLLKAIKEAEFDREMGKLSKADAEEMIAVYRLRAIDVIKEIDQLETGTAGTVREQIEREVKARLELDAKADKARADAKADAAKGKKAKEKAKAKPDKKPEAKPEEAKTEKPAPEPEPEIESLPDSTEAPSEERGAKEATS